MPGDEYSPLLKLPEELLLVVLHFLDPTDILRIRQSCSRIYIVSLDRTLWIDVATHLSNLLPLPSIDRIRAFSLSELEHATVRATKVEKGWLSSRPTPPRKINSSHALGALDYLELFDNRFAIGIYAAPCVVLLWDLDGLQPRENTPQFEWGRLVGEWRYNVEGYLRPIISFKSCKAQFRESTREIFVSFFVFLGVQFSLNVISCDVSGNPALTRPFRQVIHLTEETCSITSPTSSDMASTSTVHCSPEAITITSWKQGYSKSITSVESSDHESISADWLNVEFFDPYVIAVKAHVVEIYIAPVDTGDKESAHQKLTRIDTLQLPDNNFRSASLSHRRANANRGTPFTVTLILSDALNLILRCTISLPHNPYGTDTVFSCTTTMSNLEASLRSRSVWASEVALGSQGLRGAWIEKSRTNMERRVVAFATDGDQATTRSRKVFLTSSPDMREDLTRIACDEVTGRILLATRGGNLWVLDCWQGVPVERRPLARFQGHS